MGVGIVLVLIHILITDINLFQNSEKPRRFGGVFCCLHFPLNFEQSPSQTP